METTTILLLLIGIAIPIIICYLFRNGGKISIKSPAKTNSPTPSPTPASKTNDKSAIWNLLAGLVVICLLIWAGIAGFRYVKSLFYSNDDNKSKTETSSTPQETIIFDGFTPCDPIIDCKAKIETYGNPIYETFTGSSIPFYFDGTDNDPGQPADAKAGPVHMTSANPKKPNVRVIIKKKL